MVEGLVDWLLPKGPQVFGTVNTKYPLSLGQHERIGYELRRMYADRCGESPTVLMAVQENPSREGYHSHPLLCGTPALLGVKRRDVWADLMAQLRLQHGGGQAWTDAGGGFDHKGGAFYRHPVSVADSYNSPRVRLEPVKSRADVTGYCSRYAMREGDGLIVITGDHWGMEWQVG